MLAGWQLSWTLELVIEEIDYEYLWDLHLCTLTKIRMAIITVVGSTVAFDAAQRATIYTGCSDFM